MWPSPPTGACSPTCSHRPGVPGPAPSGRDRSVPYLPGGVAVACMLVP
jgi:hypothetical protein